MKVSSEGLSIAKLASTDN